MNIFKKVIGYLLITLLVIGMCGCDASAKLDMSGVKSGSQDPSVSSVPSQSRDFDALMRDVLPLIVNTDEFSLHLSFEEPEAAGLETTGLSLGVTTKEEWDANVTSMEEAAQELENVNMEELDPDQALSLRIVKDAINRNLLLKDYYDQNVHPLGVNGGPVTLGTLIAHSPYTTVEDFERVFTLYAGLQEEFERMVTKEREMLEKGYGLTQAEIDMSIDELQGLIDGQPTAIASILDEAIDKADFLDDEKKAALKEQNAAATEQYLVPAYEYLIAEMGTFEGRTGNLGVAAVPGGKEYYEILLRSMGIDMTPEEVLTYLQQTNERCMTELEDLIQRADPIALQAAVNDSGNFMFTTMDSAEEMMGYLEQSIHSDFPGVDSFSYEIIETPEALRAPSVVAYYVMRPCDAPVGEPVGVFINRDGASSSYTTLAHEGFPGHMYQDAYAHGQGRPYCRQYLESIFTPASEGWGVYSEVVATEHATVDPLIARIGALDGLMTYILYAYADVGVNYLGWSQDEMTEALKSAMGMNVEAFAAELYENLATRGGQWVAYGLGGAKLLDLREKAQESLGADFSAVEFHRALLDVLPASLPMLEEAVDEYIDRVLEAPHLTAPVQAA